MKTNYPLIFFAFVICFFISCDNDDESNVTDVPLDAAFKADIQNTSAGGSAVKFEDMTIGQPSKWNWQFEGGTPPTSDLQNPSVSYSSPGTYNVTLSVSNAEDSSSIISEGFISVAAAQVVSSFDTASKVVKQSDQIVFTDKSSGGVTSWNWQFIPKSGGQTITSTDQNPIVTLETVGLYSVKLSASNGENSNEAVELDYIEVLDKTFVEANFSLKGGGTFAGNTVTFNDETKGFSDSYQWTFEGGVPSTSTDKNPSVTFNSPGRYKVSLVATNEFKSSTKEVDNYVVVVPSSGLQAFVPMGDGSTADSGPNAISTVLSGELAPSAGHNGDDRGALLFDGSSAIVIPNNQATQFSKNDFSVGVWVKTAESKKMMVWQNAGANGSKDNQTWLRIGDNTSSRVMRFCAEDSAGGKIINVATTDHPAISDDSWHYMVCTREGTTTKIYVDGNLVKQMDTVDLKDVSNDQDFKIGAQEGPVGTYKTFFTGLLDELVIYNKALTISEIMTLKNL